MIKKLGVIFAFAFILNWVWENFHHVLYVHYKGGEITEFILTRAALVDAFYITLVWLLAVSLFSNKSYQYIFAGVVLFLISVGIEVWALDIGRWAYSADMPVLPLLGTGLTPTVQLALTGLISYFAVSLKYD